MLFLRLTTISGIFYLYIQIVSCFDCYGEDYVRVKPYLTCKKIYNCIPGYEIQKCDRPCQPLKCVKCASGFVQPDLVHWNSTYKSCFKKTDKHTCTENDVTYRHPGDFIDIKSCPKTPFCKCNNDNCFYGPDPCICNRQFAPCKENETMDRETGRCKPCPSGYVKPPGCGVCFKDTREKVHTTSAGIVSTEVIVISSEHHIQKKTTDSTTKNDSLFNTTPSIDDDDNRVDKIDDSVRPTTQKPEVSSASPVTWLIPVILGVLAVLIVVILFVRYKRKRQGTTLNDEEEGGGMNGVPVFDPPQVIVANPLPNGRIRRNNSGGGDNAHETEIRPLLNGDCHHTGENGNDLNLQDDEVVECNGASESILPCENNNAQDPQHYQLQKALNIKKSLKLSNGGLSPASKTTPDPSTSEAGGPVASPSTDINSMMVSAEGGANGVDTSGPLEGNTDRVKPTPTIALDGNRKTCRQESKSENNKPIASPSDSESPESSMNSLSHDHHVNQKALLSGKTEPLPSDIAEVNFQKAELTPDENEEDTEQKRCYRKSMEDSGFDTNK